MVVNGVHIHRLAAIAALVGLAVLIRWVGEALGVQYAFAVGYLAVLVSGIAYCLHLDDQGDPAARSALVLLLLVPFVGVPFLAFKWIARRMRSHPSP